MDKTVNEKQKGLGTYQVPITTNPSLGELLHKLMLLRVTNYEEESPYKPEAYELRLFWTIAHVSAHKDMQGFQHLYFCLNVNE